MQALPPADNERPICGAKKRDGEVCEVSPMENGRCRMHGGATPKGAASPSFKHGKYSAYLDGLSLARYYEESLSDGELGDLREEIALLEGRKKDLLVRLRAGDGEQAWLAAGKLMSEFRAANQRKDLKRQLELLSELSNLLARGAEDYAIWGEVYQVIDRQARLQELAQRRQEKLGLMIPAEKAYAIFTAFLDVVRRNVSDQSALSAITAEFRRLTGRSHS